MVNVSFSKAFYTHLSEQSKASLLLDVMGLAKGFWHSLGLCAGGCEQDVYFLGICLGGVGCPGREG